MAFSPTRVCPAHVNGVVVMRTVRFPIAGLMAVVLFVALGLAALRNGSQTWAGATFLLTCGVLCLAVVGVVCGGEAARAWWLGFALFGWGYLALAFWSSVELPTMSLMDAIGSRLGVPVQFSGGMGGMGGGMRSVSPLAGGFGGGVGGLPDRSIQQIAHCLWALLAALLGGILAHVLFGGRRERAEILDPHTQVADRTLRGWWRWPAALGLAGCVIILFLTWFGSRSVPGFWAGATFLLTCGLLGVTVLGVAGGHEQRRHLWLGAAVFGVGYLTLALVSYPDSDAWPSLPSNYLLNAIRRWSPAVVSTSSTSTTAANSRVWEALARPVPMQFPDETPLEDILKSIQAATRGPDGKGIPIYVDPIGMQEAEKTMSSTVMIDLEGVALKETLRLCLKQLDLSYSIRDGFVLITSEESAVTPVYQDPFLIVGHCLIALLAAGFGVIVAPLVSYRGRELEPEVRRAH
jgi:hypothetical protein